LIDDLGPPSYPIRRVFGHDSAGPGDPLSRPIDAPDDRLEDTGLAVAVGPGNSIGDKLHAAELTRQLSSGEPA